MRINIHKRHSTKAERRFAELLKRNRISFRFRVLIQGREVDFLIADRVVIEIDGHEQDRSKNKMLLEAGYDVIHLTNDEVREETYQNIIRKCLPHAHQVK